MDGTPVDQVEGMGRLLLVKKYLVDREVSSARMEGMMREGMRYVDHAREAIHEANTKLDNCEKALEWISDNRQKLQVENRGLSNRNLHLENVVDLQETKINALEEQKTVLLKQITELEKQLAQGSTSSTQEDPATPTPEVEDEEEEPPQDYSDEEMIEYTWKIYATKVLNMGSMYGFWRTLNKEERLAKQRYLQMFYNL